MDNEKVAAFLKHYENMNEWELFELQKKSTLTQEASLAIDQTISERGIDLSKLKEEEALELAKQAMKAQNQQVKNEKQDGRYLKMMMIVGLSIIIIGALFRAEKAYETLVSSLVQVAVFTVIYWVFKKFKHAHNKQE